MEWILSQLANGTPLPMTRLVEAVSGRLDEEMVRLLVTMLVKQGLVAILAR